jgi:hypothetical protein
VDEGKGSMSPRRRLFPEGKPMASPQPSDDRIPMEKHGAARSRRVRHVGTAGGAEAGSPSVWPLEIVVLPQKENYIWWRTIVPDGERPSITRAGALEGGWSMAKKKAAKKKKK